MFIVNVDIMALYWVVVYHGAMVQKAVPWRTKRPAEEYCLQLRQLGRFGKIIKDYNYETGDSNWGHWECSS